MRLVKVFEKEYFYVQLFSDYKNKYCKAIQITMYESYVEITIFVNKTVLLQCIVFVLTIEPHKHRICSERKTIVCL